MSPHANSNDAQRLEPAARPATDPEASPAARAVCIAFTSGCPRAEMDTSVLFRYFRANGWRIERSIPRADLVVVSACGVDAHAEDRNVELLKIADKTRKLGSRLVVLGCLAGISAARLRAQFDAALVPPSGLDALDAIIGAGVPFRQVPDANWIEPELRQAKRCFGAWNRLQVQFKASWSFRQKAAWELKQAAGRALGRHPPEHDYKLRVARGCLGQCSYCGIRFATGPLRSKPLDVVLSEFEAGLQQGFRTIDLVADDVGAYGQDLGTNLVELMRRLFRRDADFLLKLTDVNPRWIVQYDEELAALWAPPCRARIGRLLVPLQSGSEKILRLMRRPYTAADARAHLLRLQAAVPTIYLATHVIVGFPGETADDFEDTVRLLEGLPLQEIGVFEYSDRPGTEAIQFPDRVPEAAIRKRIQRLVARFPGIARHFC
jgi:ribosomal protein S12 methylthiotransferase